MEHNGPVKEEKMIVLNDAKKLEELLDRIFTDDFMKKHTKHASFEEFKYSSAVFVNWGSDTLIYAEQRLDGFVNESTSFSDWEEMVHKGVEELKRVKQ